MKLDEIHGGHGQTSPVNDAADIAVHLDIDDACVLGFDLDRLLLADISQSQHRRTPVQSVVIYDHL